MGARGLSRIAVGVPRTRVLAFLAAGCVALACAACNLDDLVESHGPTDPAAPDSTPGSTSGQGEAPAIRLSFEVQPSDVEAGDAIRPAVTVLVQDSTGRTVSEYDGTVTLSMASGPSDATFAGAGSRPVVEGVATFDDLSIGRAAEYRLEAAADDLERAVSATFSVMPAPAAAIEASSGQGQRDSVAATLSQPYVVLVTDEHGNPVPDVTVTWSVVKGEGSVAPAIGQTDVQGKAAATHTLGTAAGEQIVVATVAGLSGVAATLLSHATAGNPVLLDVVQQPTNTRTGAVIAPPITVRIVDQFGNAATGFTESVSIRLVPLTGTILAQLSGTLSRRPSAGVVAFDDLSINLPGVNYRLRITTDLLSRDTRTFDVF